MTGSTAVLLTLALAGCSLIYNPNNLPSPIVDGDSDGGGGRDGGDGGGGGGGDGMDVDAPLPPPVDADDRMLAVFDISPASIEEGQGDGGSRPALFVVRGQNIVNNNLKVELVPPHGVTVQVAPADAVASRNASYLAFTVAAHVDPALARDVPLTVRVTQEISAQYGGGMVVKELPMPLVLHGLPELTAASPEVNATTKVLTIPASPPTYSRVDLSGITPLTFSTQSSKPVAITAVSSIALGAVLADASGTTAGPGGFAGGAAPGAGPGGGGVGGSVGLGGGGGGGGGAGFAVTGGAGDKGAGTGGSGGGAGQATGDDMLLLAAANRASAGGAGGRGGLLALVDGGAGGGGGGTVVLFADGDIAIASISAKGGDGESRSAGGGGGGGGGAGGAVLVSAQDGALSVGTISVAAGNAGAPNGGAGSVGRVRWDAPAGNAPGSPDATAHRGPTFASVARVTTQAGIQVAMNGPSNAAFRVQVRDQDNLSHAGEDGSFDGAGAATIIPPLRPGRNQLCVTLEGGSAGSPAEKCVDIAFLP